MKYTLLLLGFLLPSVVAAQSVDLLWQGINYTPPFYQGGALWSEQGSLVFYAVPQGLGDPAKLIYKWTKDGTVLGLVSGLNQNTLYSNDPIFSKPQTVKVEIVDDNDNVLASRATTLTPVAPNLLVYEKSPLYGYMFHREVGATYRIDGEEVVFTGFPLFFSSFDRDNNSLAYAWRSNTGEDSTLSSVTYRVPDNAEGTASISASLMNEDTLKQRAERSFLVQFGHEE